MQVVNQNVRLLDTILLLITIFLLACCQADYRIGVGISDITGPIAEVGFMGYAKATQKGSGLHLRQYARAFIIEDGRTQIVFVNVDVCMVGHGLRKQVLQDLERKYGDIYNTQNLILSATHTHSAPAGYMMDLLFDITSFGFVRETFVALASGIVKAVEKAHANKVNGRIFLNSGQVLDVNINRSPAAYLLNPEFERKQYAFNVDKEITQLKFVATENNDVLGSIQWFPVHPTSMNNTNKLVSSDNVGYASVLLEKYVNRNSLPGQGPFVSAFASSNLGDVSPNTRGPHCTNTGDACDGVTSTCDGEASLCIAFGSGKDMFDSTKIIAEKLYDEAKRLLDDTNDKELTGPLKIGQKFVHMPSQVVHYELPNGTTIKGHGCLPAMGYSFAAGTTDGPGEFDFKQGTVSDNLLWNTIRDFIATPAKEDIACHHPKPILLATGRIKFPYQWQPSIVSIQVAFIGDAVIAAVPGEFTTMSGRRLKNTIKAAVEANGGSKDTTVIIAGLSNVYSDYITTPEEYQLQRYEAASTVYGPHTLPIYQSLYGNLVNALMNEVPLETGPNPPDLSKNLISFIPPVLFDWAGFSGDFGDCIKQPPRTARIGDKVTARFIAGHPRNNVMHGKTFLTVDKKIDEDDWIVIATDASWETKFKWRRTSLFTGTSEAIVEWTIGNDVTPGIYRIRHFGHYKYVLGGIFPYEGVTNNIKVV